MYYDKITVKEHICDERKKTVFQENISIRLNLVFNPFISQLSVCKPLRYLKNHTYVVRMYSSGSLGIILSQELISIWHCVLSIHVCHIKYTKVDTPNVECIFLSHCLYYWCWIWEFLETDLKNRKYNRSISWTERWSRATRVSSYKLKTGYLILI